MPLRIASSEDQQAWLQLQESIRGRDLGRTVHVLRTWIRNEGWRFMPSNLYDKYADHVFDRRFGTDTKTITELAELHIDSPNKTLGERYQASPSRPFRRVISLLDIDYQEFAFVDFGSGRGRTLLLASSFPFRKVVGVEFSGELHRSAEANIAKFFKDSPRDVRSVHCDASLYELPPDKLVLYFFNPFSDEVLVRVLDNVAESVRRHPRRVLLVFLYLPNPELIEGRAGFGLRAKWHRFHVFEYRPDGTGRASE
jgi:hypothetical protein